MGNPRREENDEKNCYRQETRQQDGVAVQMPNPPLDCESFFSNKHNGHFENQSWQLITHGTRGPGLSAFRVFTNELDRHGSEVPGQSGLVAIREHPDLP